MSTTNNHTKLCTRTCNSPTYYLTIIDHDHHYTTYGPYHHYPATAALIKLFTNEPHNKKSTSATIKHAALIMDMMTTYHIPELNLETTRHQHAILTKGHTWTPPHQRQQTLFTPTHT